MQRDAGWTEDVGTDDHGGAGAWENLKTELTPALLAVPTTVEKVLHLSREALASLDDV